MEPLCHQALFFITAQYEHVCEKDQNPTETADRLVQVEVTSESRRTSDPELKVAQVWKFP